MRRGAFISSGLGTASERDKTTINHGYMSALGRQELALFHALAPPAF